MDDTRRAAAAQKARDRANRTTRRIVGQVVAVTGTQALISSAGQTKPAEVPASVPGVVVGATVRIQDGPTPVVESVLGSIAVGSMWSGRLASSPGTLTASQYRSLGLSTMTRSVGLAPTFSGHCIEIPETRPWSIDLQGGFTTTSTSGDRLVGLWLNPNATTWASSSLPSTGSWLRSHQIPAGGASTMVAALWRGLLDAGALVMPIFRATAATGVSTAQWDTELTIEAC